MLSIEDLHRKILYPTVLVRTEKAGGSGTVFAAIERDDEWLVYILTNHHVINDAIQYKEEWDHIVGADLKTEIRSPVSVIFYTYRHLSRLDSEDARRGDVVAYDKTKDVALVEMVAGKPPEYIATMLPRDKTRNLRMGMPVVACGCSLGHKPLFSPDGHITSLDERIDNLAYTMTCTSIIFGNSGGGMYLKETGEFIGIPSRLDVSIVGYSAQAMPFLNYIIPVERVYDLLDRWEYQFVYDPEQSYEECEKRRKDKMSRLRKDWLDQFSKERGIAIGGDISDSESDETGKAAAEAVERIWGPGKPK
jgi:hypothetical protein